MNGIRDLEIKQNNLIYYGILFCLVVGIVIFSFYPIYKILEVSFYDESGLTLKYYEGIFRDNYPLLKNTLITSIISALLSTIFGGMIAFYMIFSKERVRKFFHYILMLTMISPPFIFGISYITLFGRRGLITYRLLGLHTNPYGLRGIILLQLIGELSFATFMLYELFKGLDYNLIAVSRSLGANMLESIKRVLLPISVPAFLGTFFILFTKNLADFGSAIIMGGRYSTLATEAYLTVIGEGNMPKGSAMTLLLIFPALLSYMLYRLFLSKKKNEYNQNKGNVLRRMEFSFPIYLKLVLGVVAWSFFGIMLLQYGAIFFSGFYNYTTKGIAFTLEYLERFKLSTLDVFARTLIYALIAGFFSAIIGVLISYFNKERDSILIKVIEFFSSLPYIIPGTFFGLGYILAFNDGVLTLTGTATIVVLNCIFRQISIGIKAGDSILARFDLNLLKAGRDLGATNLNLLLDIVLPNLKSAFLIAFINCFIATMTTIGAIIFLISPGANVATVVLFNYVSQGEYGLASITALAITLITFSLNILVVKFLNNGEKE